MTEVCCKLSTGIGLVASAVACQVGLSWDNFTLTLVNIWCSRKLRHDYLKYRMQLIYRLRLLTDSRSASGTIFQLISGHVKRNNPTVSVGDADTTGNKNSMPKKAMFLR
jgi:hypothetical protein